MMASEDDIRRERARARLAARQGRALPDAGAGSGADSGGGAGVGAGAGADEGASGRMLIPRQGTPLSKRSDSSRAITQEDLDAVNARRKGARKQNAQSDDPQASGKLPRIDGKASRGGSGQRASRGGRPGGKRGQRASRGGQWGGQPGNLGSGLQGGSRGGNSLGNSRGGKRKGLMGGRNTGRPPRNSGFSSRGAGFSSSGGFSSKPKSRLQAILPKALLVLVILALIAGLVFLGRVCVAKVNDFIADYQARHAEPPEPGPVPDFFEVSAIVGDNLAFKLIEKSILLDDAYWIAMNVDQYEQYGATYQRKLIRLAAMDTNAVSFVRGYPESYPAESGQSGLPAWEGEGVPLYYQYDERWGYVEYGGKGFALTGCGPTCLAMVYQHITGQNDMSPYDMGVFASNNGYVTESDGTYTSFFLEGSTSLGLYPHDLPISADSITWALQNNGVIIANMREGDFTEGGHYIVLAGLDGEGKLIVNDPYSSINSAKTWDLDTVMSQSVRMVAFYKS